ncbi:hypothetical protein BT96DRAFT_513179 [Gymnopus androsaceus JB14]|uniref:C2H2-type domain-containing protein n=1 Tax=Gymnopus androsaceus JB14 TaxID=1447944 RepID=A0A6A4GLQ9_9AGAR|nr:hypothetical protein BT96DRAFT_513179 [Gymnopus androsaceus JB14]
MPPSSNPRSTSSEPAEMPSSGVPRDLSRKVFRRYHDIQSFFHSEFKDLEFPEPKSIEWWENFVKTYSGLPENFETWVWGTLGTSESIVLSLPAYKPPTAADSNGNFFCNYYDCQKEYQSKQGWENHFNGEHLGFRVHCPECDASLKNPGSLPRHRREYCRKQKDI